MKNAYVKEPVILWADDDPDEIALMREVLGELDNTSQIVEAHNGQKVLEFLHHAVRTGTLPCLIVLDINMPVLNGKDALVSIKLEAALKDIPVVVFTTSSSAIDRAFCMAYGTEMLTKPVTFAALKEVVQKLLKLCDVSATR